MDRKPDDHTYLEMLGNKIDELSLDMEKLGIAEYVMMIKNPRRLFWVNFWQGVARGFGMAIGFTVLAALVIYILQRLVVLNTPLIGSFIAEIVNIVQNQLYVK
ncbi:Uncharacterized [Syntrophomonas zehnderi OL-4]|uniref:Uncharacterized n=2 Tax=Syntrophomonas TaxID=862 RepID=A0A0E4GAQ5_9FIRM|nr:Uncharacterized [Syntrophomonas zehnderi OL-4]